MPRIIPKNKYWEQREKYWVKQQAINDENFSYKLVQKYEKTYKEIERDINNFYIQYASKTGLSMNDARKSVDTFDVQAFSKEAKRMVEEKDFSKYANDRLRTYNATMRINRLEYIKSQVGTELLQLTNDLDADFNKELNNQYMERVKFQSGILGVNVNKSILRIMPTVINASYHGATWSERLWINNDELKARLDSLLTKSMIQGVGPKELARQLRDQLNKEVKNGRYVTERLMRTETARVQDAASMKIYQKNGIQYVKWIAEVTAEKQCLDIAAENDGIYPIDKAPVIPVHANCRCSKAAYVPRTNEI